MEYTKGEWEFCPGEFNCPEDEETSEQMPGSIISGASDDKGGWFICRIDNAPEYESNARLIAAAPDMYEALKDALLCVENREQKGKISGINWDGLVFDMRKALAKAEGK